MQSSLQLLLHVHELHDAFFQGIIVYDDLFKPKLHGVDEDNESILYQLSFVKVEDPDSKSKLHVSQTSESYASETLSGDKEEFNVKADGDSLRSELQENLASDSLEISSSSLGTDESFDLNNEQHIVAAASSFLWSSDKNDHQGNFDLERCSAGIKCLSEGRRSLNLDNVETHSRLNNVNGYIHNI